MKPFTFDWVRVFTSSVFGCLIVGLSAASYRAYLEGSCVRAGYPENTQTEFVSKWEAHSRNPSFAWLSIWQVKTDSDGTLSCVTPKQQAELERKQSVYDQFLPDPSPRKSVDQMNREKAELAMREHEEWAGVDKSK